MSTSSPRVRLKDIAAVAGVSTMAVSLALRNHTSLPPSTRSRIQKLATELGYRPDPEINLLMERVRGKRPRASNAVLAYVTAHDQRRAWKDIPTHRDYHDGAAARADELGYRLEEFWLREPGMTEERLSRILRNRSIEGVLIAPLQYPGSLFQKFHWHHFSVVELGYSLRTPVLHRCCNQQFQSMMLLLDRLIDTGYRRIGLAMGPGQDERANHHWRAAYLATQSLHPGKDIHPLPMLFGETATWNRDTFARWLDEASPDVVVTIGVDVERWLAKLGLRVPADIGLANVDINNTMPGVTGINQNALQVGSAAVDLLLSLMRTGSRGLPAVPRSLMVDGDFVQGKTTRSRPRRRAAKRNASDK